MTDMTTNPKTFALLISSAAFFVWLLFFAGPELFDRHSTIGLIGAIAIYVNAPFALFAAYRFARSNKETLND